MVKGCVTSKDELHLYCFPKDPELGKEWAYQVEQTRGKWETDTIQLISICAASILKETAFSCTAS